MGDEVLAIAEWKDKGKQASQDQRLSYEKVTDIFTSYKEQTLVHLTLANGEQLTATEGHPFKTSEGWKDAILLKRGGKLLKKGGDADSEPAIEITEIRTERKTLPVYNIEVANAHTYFVGIDGVGVHNGGCNKFDKLGKWNVQKKPKNHVPGKPPEKDHVHWGKNSDPRANAVNKDGTPRHGPYPPKDVLDHINNTQGWNLP